MRDDVPNRRDPGDIDDAEVVAALARIGARDPARATDADHVVQALTWGEGMGRVDQASLQNWLWYELPTKYMTDEVGYMGRLAGVAAELFDELGLDRYAQVCRSETTAGVHAGFERSTGAGFEAFRRARDASGIDPPSTDTFVWGDVMGFDESSARSAVSSALEAAIAGGTLDVGGRAWRKRQRALTEAALDADHPTLPGQSWRTVVLTERVGRWIADAERRSDVLAGLRTQVANALLGPVDVPDDVADRLAPLLWLLAELAALLDGLEVSVIAAASQRPDGAGLTGDLVAALTADEFVTPLGTVAQRTYQRALAIVTAQPAPAPTAAPVPADAPAAAPEAPVVPPAPAGARQWSGTGIDDARRRLDELADAGVDPADVQVTITWTGPAIGDDTSA